MLSGSEAGCLKRLRVEKRDISQLRMRTMRCVGLVVLDAGKTTINGTKEARSHSSRRPNRKTGMGMTLLSAVSNTRETLEVANRTLDEQKIE